MDFGEWLKEQRLNARLSLEELAERVGCSRNYLSVLERNTPHHKTGALPNPSPEILRGIATGLDISPRQVFEVYQRQFLTKEGDAEPDFDPNQDDPQVMAYYNALPEPVKDDVKAQLEALYKKHQRSQTTHGKKAE